MLSCNIRQSSLLKAITFFLLCLVLFLNSNPAAADSSQLNVVGNQVITASGQQFIPEGISVYGGLEAPDYTVNQANVYAQIKAAALYWHANTIRLQVAESNLFSHIKKGQAYNQKFMTDLMNEVQYGHSLGMLVVVNDQTDFTTNTPMPTAITAKFWQVMVNKFRTKPYVIFDVFNEPRLTNVNSTNTGSLPKVLSELIRTSGHDNKHQKTQVGRFDKDKVWSIWRNGGIVNGTKYLGMQNIVQQIRATGDTNLIWVEGSYTAQKMPPSGYLLNGTNLVYAIHHPDLNSPTSWQDIGNLARTQPVVEGEWSQYESNWAECFSDAYKNASLYLQYLHSLNIGIIGWSLQAGSLLKDSNHLAPANLNEARAPNKASELDNPSRLLPSYNCNGSNHGQGVGSLLMNYFSENSMKYSVN